MPTPSIVPMHQEQTTSYDIPLDQFRINFGYKDRDHIQIRLEKDGSVYLGDHRNSRRFDSDRLTAGTVPFELLAKEWTRFVEYMVDKAAELKEEEQSND